MSVINLSEETIFRKLLALNGNKAPGPDALHPHLLNSCAASLTTPLFLLAQQSLASGSVPVDFSKIDNRLPLKIQDSERTEYVSPYLTCGKEPILPQYIKMGVNSSHQTIAQLVSHLRW